MALKGKSKGAKAKKAAKGASDTAKDLARTKVTEARDWAAPRFESAVGTVNSEVVPRVRGYIDQATTAAGPTVDEARLRSARALAALRGVEIPEPPKKKKKRGRKVLLVMLGVAAVGGVAAAMWSRRNANGFDYYSLPADDFGRGEHGTNGNTARHGTDQSEADPGQPVMPNTEAAPTNQAGGKHAE